MHVTTAIAVLLFFRSLSPLCHEGGQWESPHLANWLHTKRWTSFNSFELLIHLSSELSLYKWNNVQMHHFCCTYILTESDFCFLPPLSSVSHVSSYMCCPVFGAVRKAGVCLTLTLALSVLQSQLHELLNPFINKGPWKSNHPPFRLA